MRPAGHHRYRRYRGDVLHKNINSISRIQASFETHFVERAFFAIFISVACMSRLLSSVLIDACDGRRRQ